MFCPGRDVLAGGGPIRHSRRPRSRNDRTSQRPGLPFESLDRRGDGGADNGVEQVVIFPRRLELPFVDRPPVPFRPLAVFGREVIGEQLMGVGFAAVEVQRSRRSGRGEQAFRGERLPHVRVEHAEPAPAAAAPAQAQWGMTPEQARWESTVTSGVTSAIVAAPGSALCIAISKLDKVKRESASIERLFARYADCLLAQIMHRQ